MKNIEEKNTSNIDIAVAYQYLIKIYRELREVNHLTPKQISEMINVIDKQLDEEETAKEIK